MHTQQDTKHKSSGLIKRFIPYYKKYVWVLVLDLFCAALTTVCELVLPLIGAIFVAEALSVIIQVISFKSTGRRVFRMSPLHHHFELGGWSETKVVGVFWLVGLVCGLLGLWVVLSSTVGGLK